MDAGTNKVALCAIDTFVRQQSVDNLVSLTAAVVSGRPLIMFAKGVL